MTSKRIKHSAALRAALGSFQRDAQFFCDRRIITDIHDASITCSAFHSMNNVCRASSVIRVWIIGSVSTSAESSASAEVTEQTPVSIKTAEALAFSLPCKLPHLMRYAAIAPCIPLGERTLQPAY